MADYRDASINDEALGEPEGECCQANDADEAEKKTTSVDRDDTTDTEVEIEQPSVDETSDDVSQGVVSDEESPEEAAKLTDVIIQLNNLTDLFKAKISRSEYEEQVLKRYSDEIHEYKADLYKKIMLPLIKEVISARDATRAILERAQNKSVDEDVVDIDSVEFISEILETALDNHGVTAQTPLVGSMPDKTTARPIGRVKTTAAEKHGAIAEVMNDAYMMDDRCIAPAIVKLFAYDATLEQQKTLAQTVIQPESDERGADESAPSEQPELQEVNSAEQSAPVPMCKPE